jgi:hypothetical protein
MRKAKYIMKHTDNSAEYKSALHWNLKYCPICRPHSGCNRGWFTNMRSWKKYRKTQYRDKNIREVVMKKLLLIIPVFLLLSCDFKVKRCTYDVYQQGKILPEKHVEYTLRLSDRCKDFSKGNLFFKLKDVDIVKAKDVRH